MPPAERSHATITAELLVELARIGGVELTTDRATLLLPQAVAHFELMRSLDELDPRGAEIAPEFTLEYAEHGA